MFMREDRFSFVENDGIHIRILLVVWNPFCGPLFLRIFCNYSNKIMHGHVTGGEIWYVG